MKNSRNFHKLENQARQFFGDDFWSDILSAIPNVENTAHAETVSPQDARQAQTAKYARAAQPAMDVYRTERHLTVHMELPGLRDISTVDVSIQNGQLVISGHVGGHFHKSQVLHAERFHGDFRRVVPLPDPIEEEQIQARYKHGLLEIILPFRRKRRDDPPFRIPIRRDDT